MSKKRNDIYDPDKSNVWPPTKTNPLIDHLNKMNMVLIYV